MSRGANKENNIASRFIAQGAFSNIGTILPTGDPSLKSRSISPHEAKLQNFLKKVVVGQKVPLKPSSNGFHTKNSSSRGSPRSSVNTIEHIEHSQRDRYHQHLSSSSERLNALADSTHVHINREKARSVTPQQQVYSRGSERSPDDTRIATSSRSTANAQQQKNKTPQVSGEFWYEETQRTFTENLQAAQPNTRNAKSNTKGMVSKDNGKGQGTKQLKGQALKYSKATVPQTVTSLDLGSLNENSYHSPISQTQEFLSNDSGTTRLTKGSDQPYQKSSVDLNPLLRQFLEQTNIKDVLEMDINEMKRIKTENKQLEGTFIAFEIIEFTHCVLQ